MRIWSNDGVYIAITVSIMLLALYQLWQRPLTLSETPTEQPTSEIPDFANYSNVQQKKSDFFNFLLPKIQQANSVEENRRNYLLNLTATDLSSTEQAELYALAKRYRVKLKDRSAAELKSTLLNKVDQVPAALILAQAANESAWGTSRFARDGNNLFGLWCFTPGCGLKPLQRDSGARHEVERFASVQDGVNQYVKTINSHPAYTDLRKIRFELRSTDQTVTGDALAAGLMSYSERGQDYIDEIQEMIRFNDLEKFN